MNFEGAPFKFLKNEENVELFKTKKSNSSTHAAQAAGVKV
jgi:hypothetical protein